MLRAVLRAVLVTGYALGYASGYGTGYVTGSVTGYVPSYAARYGPAMGRLRDVGPSAAMGRLWGGYGAVCDTLGVPGSGLGIGRTQYFINPLGCIGWASSHLCVSLDAYRI